MTTIGAIYNTGASTLLPHVQLKQTSISSINWVSFIAQKLPITILRKDCMLLCLNRVLAFINNAFGECSSSARRGVTTLADSSAKLTSHSPLNWLAGRVGQLIHLLYHPPPTKHVLKEVSSVAAAATACFRYVTTGSIVCSGA